MDDVAVSDVLARLARSRFRRRFRLNDCDQHYIADKTLPVIAAHAADFVAQRLAAAHPLHDGRQTPWRGHPVFVAQHATATCCRRCLQRWHGIGAGTALSDSQRAYVVRLIMAWIERQTG